MNGSSKITRRSAAALQDNIDGMHSLGQFTRGDTPKAERVTGKIAGSLYRYHMLRNAAVQDKVGNRDLAHALRATATKSRKASDAYFKKQAINRSTVAKKAAATRKAKGWSTTTRVG